MSYSGCLVYLPPDEDLATLAEWLGEKLTSAKTKVAAGAIEIVFSNGAGIRLALDQHPCVAEEAKELIARAPAAAKEALRASNQRLEIVPSDPRTDPDDVYNELLFVFEALQARPGCVGLDPFDGSVSFAAATKG